MTQTAQNELIQVMKTVLQQEAHRILLAKENIELMVKMVKAAHTIVDSPKPILFAGIGKSGHIARKLASTFRSLGTPSVFLHAAEASHGDLGLVQKGGVVIALSNSGETPEFSDLLHHCKQNGVFLIALTQHATSTMGSTADLVLNYGSVEEACRNGQAPTTSTTLMLALGDALAVTTSVLNKVEPEDFRRHHPGGQLGRKMRKIKDIARGHNRAPLVFPETAMTDVVLEMTQKNLGMAVVISRQNKVMRTITDGDLRRNGNVFWNLKAQDIMSKNPFSLPGDTTIEVAASLMSERKVTSALLIGSENTFEAIVHLHDCLDVR